jgi:chromosome segregation ATPase
LHQQVGLLKNQIDEIENKYRAQSYQLAQLNQDFHEQKSAATQIRLIAEESERALEEQRRQISNKNEELHNSQQINLKLEQKLMDSQELNHSLKDELNALRMTINSLDKDKDKLITNVDEKAEENVTLKEELSSKVRIFVEKLLFVLE